MKTEKDIIYNNNYPKDDILDIYLPDSDTFSVFVYIHGGGLEEGNKGVAIAEDLTAKNIAVVSIDYRLYPDAKYPDYIGDAAAAVDWVYKNIGKYGKCEKVFIGGSSAGGYITQMLCFDKKYLAAYGIDADKVNGYVMDAGQPTVHFNVLRERGIDTRRIIVDEAAPLYYVTANDYAPMDIIVSDNDMENRYEQTILLYSTLKHFRCDMSKVQLDVIKHSGHCEYLGKLNEDGSSVFAGIIYSFIKKYL